jgi:hypothetical protein
MLAADAAAVVAIRAVVAMRAILFMVHLFLGSRRSLGSGVVMRRTMPSAL